MKFKLVPIESIKIKKYSGRVHDLTVNKDHSYNVFNILVHNSICSTRTSTGFGVPLLTTVEDCAQVKCSSLLIADGGVQYVGDIAKVIAFGGDFVMSGRLWAATDLASGECYDKKKEFLCEYNRLDDEIETAYSKDVIYRKYIAYKRYSGMASREARKGVMKDASIEGVSGLIKYNGKTIDFIKDISNNLKASLSYAGSRNWDEFKMNVKKIRISPSSWQESLTYVEN